MIGRAPSAGSDRPHRLDIETAIQEKRFALNRSQVVGMIAAILTALDRPDNDRTVRTIVPAMMPLAPRTLAGIGTAGHQPPMPESARMTDSTLLAAVRLARSLPPVLARSSSTRV